MKKIIYLTAILFIFFETSFIFAQERDIFGEYEVSFGYSMTVKSGPGSSGPDVKPIVKITEVDENHVNIILPDFVFSEKMKVASFEIKNVELSDIEEGKELKLGKFTSSDGNYQITGYSLQGKIQSGLLDFKVTYKAGKMPFKLTVNYKSTE
ncbi:MAG: calycin-like domain-containing protein [Treponema sp.]|nr:calycin-like domain-containing protein [Treponema sp.]